MTANFDTKHLLKKLRTVHVLSLQLQTASTDTPGAILFHSTKSATMSSTALIVVYLAKDTGDAWSDVQQQPYNFYCDNKTFMCSSSPTQSLGGSMEKASGNMSQVFCPPQPDKLSATLLVLWFAFCWSRSYTMSPTQFLTLFSRKAMNASFWYCRRCVTAIGSWSMNSEREMVKLFNKELHMNPILILCLFTTSQVIPGCDVIIP